MSTEPNSPADSLLLLLGWASKAPGAEKFGARICEHYDTVRKALVPATPAPESPAPARTDLDWDLIDRVSKAPAQSFLAPEVGTGSETSPDASRQEIAPIIDSVSELGEMICIEHCGGAPEDRHCEMCHYASEIRQDLRNLRTSSALPDAGASPDAAGLDDLLVVWRDNGEALVTTRKYPDDTGVNGAQCWPKGIDGYYLATHCRKPIIHPSALSLLAKPAEQREAEQIPHPVAEAEQSSPSHPPEPLDLAAKLALYTSHIHSPGPMCERAKHSDYPCTCGLEKLLAALAQAPTRNGKGE